jgi:starch phosphorylase
MKAKCAKIAYFSAEIGISAKLPTYSGGLGVLAGDHIKAAADAGIELCGVTLLYKEGYFKQRVDENGNQTELYPRFDPYPFLKKLDISLTLKLRERNVVIQVFEYIHTGLSGHSIPIYFLDTDVTENIHDDRIITMRLYSGDKDHRILQEAILGFGGISLLEKMGCNKIQTYHINEGHAAFLTLALLRKYNGNIDEVKKLCHFTTHTPVDAGHDHFSINRCKKLLHGLLDDDLKTPSSVQNNRLHMTELGLYFSHSVNGVSRLHEEVARAQFPEYDIGHVTNGVYHPYWIGKSFRILFDRELSGWRIDPIKLKDINKISRDEIWHAHSDLKDFLLGYVNSQTQKALSNDVLTIGFARRAAEYKRARLIFSDIERLSKIGEGKIQIIFAGKAHPRDSKGKHIIREIVQNAQQLFGKVKVVYLENYNLWLGRLITAGVDVWLNTPLRPNEASGTSGMKASLNGVLNLSTLDGWWAEACNHGKNGWGIGDPMRPDDYSDANQLYNLLENDVIRLFYNDREAWINMMLNSIITGIQYTAYRMIRQYNQKYYNV